MSKTLTCRACGSAALTPAFTIEAAMRPRRNSRKPRDLSFALCDPARDPSACGLLQRVEPGEVEPFASANSSVFRTTRSHLRTVATEALETISGRDCAALDIGCNDGSLLSYYPRWVDRVGTDDAEAAEVIGDWATCVRARFGSPEADAALEGRRFDIITAISVLERSDAPKALFVRARDLLSDDGVFVVETLYAPVALARAGADAFATGATGVYTLSVLESLARSCGLKIFRGALTDKNGGSLRLFMTREGVDNYDFDPWYERLAKLWDEENALALRVASSYQAFESRARAARGHFEDLMGSIADRGATAHLLCAGDQGVALYDWAGAAGASIVAAIATKPFKAGATLCPGGPVLITETDCREAAPDYLIAPAALKREMLERWREAIQRGAKLIVPTPEPHIVHVGNYSAEYGKSLAGGDGGGEAETLRAILAAAGGPRLVAVTRAAS